MKLLGIPFILFSFLVLVSGCEWVEQFTKKTEEKTTKSASPTWKEAPKSEPATVTMKGHAIAANTFIQIAQKADPAVVNIGTTKIVKRPNVFGDFFGDDFFRRFFGEEGEGERERPSPPESKQKSLGSGFLISSDGYIVTNNHVIDQADEITVTVGKDTEYKAVVVGTDPKTDLALIKVAAKEKLPALVLGDSDALEVGEIVVAIGNPFEFSHTITQGIVSAKQRSIGFGPYDNFIQTDASINPGNSGGPLLNLKAEVVGINTAVIASGQGIGFAIPINLAKNVIQQLRSKGSVTRGWLGVDIQKVDADIAKSLNLKERKGALVSNVYKDSPAAKAGVKPRDVILRFAGKEVSDFNDLPRLVAAAPIGKKAKMVVLRDGKKMTLRPLIGELKEQNSEKEPAKTGEGEESEPTQPDLLGLSVAELTEEVSRAIGIPAETKGVVVEQSVPGKPAAEKGIRRGDVILEVNRKKTPDVATYEEVTKELKEGETVLLFIQQAGGNTSFVAFTLT